MVFIVVYVVFIMINAVFIMIDPVFIIIDPAFVCKALLTTLTAERVCLRFHWSIVLNVYIAELIARLLEACGI